jgi:predicted acyltransferase (DUF342 family)
MGDLRVEGNLLNARTDAGPLLIVLGSLEATHVALSGAQLLVGGSLRARVVNGSGTRGFLRVLGEVRADAMVLDGYRAEVGGDITGRIFDQRGMLEHAGHVRAPQEALLDELFVDDVVDRESPSRIDERALVARLEEGLPVLRRGPSTLPCKLTG